MKRLTPPSQGIQERLDRLEKELHLIREEISGHGILTPPDAAIIPMKEPFPVPHGSSDPVAPQKKIPGSIFFRMVFSGMGGIGNILRFCLISWVRNLLLCLLTLAILFSDWWLPFSSLWVLGPIWERLVILLLAGLWWWILTLFFCEPPKNTSRLVQEKKQQGNFNRKNVPDGANGRFGSRAS